MPTPVTKDPGLYHWAGIDGYRFQLGMRELGFDWQRAMLESPNLGGDSTRQVHGVHTFLNTLTGDSSAAIDDAIHTLRRSTTQQVLINVGKDDGDAAMISRGYLGGGSGVSHQATALTTFTVPFQSDEHEHAAINAVGTLANYWTPGAAALAATANGTAIQFTEAVAVDDEILFAFMEPDFPGPSAASTLAGDLFSATDQIFTTPVSRVAGLGTIGATLGVKSGVVSGVLAANLWWRVQWTVTGATPTRYPIAAFVKRKKAGYQEP